MTNDEWIKAMRAGIPEEGEFPISSYDDLHPGRFLKCGHLKGEPRTLTVTRYKGEKMGMKNGRPQVQGIMTFKEIDKQYCTQKTNEALLRAMFGDDPAAVVGKRVTFRPGKTRGKGGGIVEAIRIAGSPDMTTDEIEHTVEYAEKAMRKPETFTLTKTNLGGPKQDKPPATKTETKPPGNIEQALRMIAGTDKVTIETVLAKLRDFAWTKEESRAIKEAADKVNAKTVAIDLEDV